MRHVIFLTGFTAMLLTTACTTPQLTKNAEARQIVNRMFETFNRHDAVALAALYSVDAVVITPESCKPTVGRDAIAHNYQGLFNQVPDVIDTLQDMIVENGKVAVSFVASSQIDGMAFELPIAAILTIETGLIVRDVGYFNSGQKTKCE